LQCTLADIQRASCETNLQGYANTQSHEHGWTRYWNAQLHGLYGLQHAANAFSSVLRLELKCFGIQVTTVNPSFHGTPLVHSMGDDTSKLWEKLDPTKKEE
jgi:NAD(P)-dependent dehydrogenase (short-subunit alcohol dehydrogenase family)